MDKPTGKFQCVVCKRIWDGSQVYLDPTVFAVVWTCGDLTCGARVRKVQSEPEKNAQTEP